MARKKKKEVVQEVEVVKLQEKVEVKSSSQDSGYQDHPKFAKFKKEQEL